MTVYDAITGAPIATNESYAARLIEQGRALPKPKHDGVKIGNLKRSDTTGRAKSRRGIAPGKTDAAPKADGKE